MPTAFELDPVLFYNLVGVLRSVTEDDLAGLEKFEGRLITYQANLRDQVEKLQESCRLLALETKRVTRHRQSTALLEHGEEETEFSRHNFLGLVLILARDAGLVMREVIEITAGLRPGRLLLRKERFSGETSDYQELQHMVAEFNMNTPVILRFLTALVHLEEFPDRLLKQAHAITDMMDGYRRWVQHRHSKEGVQIFGNVVMTDVAISIYENVDGHGEIEDGKKPEEVSAYSIRRAQEMARGVRNGLLEHFLQAPEKFINWIVENLRAIWLFVAELGVRFERTVTEAHSLVPHMFHRHNATEEQMEAAILHLQDVDPNAVPFREKTELLSPEERWSLNFRNSTLENLVQLLQDPTQSPEAVIHYVLERKHALRSYFQGENSFFVCRISAGNVFGGEAPGALKVIPGTRPLVNLDEIFGDGYAEIREHALHIDATTTWHDLFVATSPSGTADKTNVLMVGPMGCGKSQVLRGVGADKKSISIFASGSDFRTCWRGEEDKNPKRLFEAAVQLERETKKHVHILIDEIDRVLQDEEKSGQQSNLRHEFQNLMDGVVHYPRITLWGATNNIERIPMPMVRRFSKVVIVGELSQDDRVKALQHFTVSLPIANYSPESWHSQARRLEGATGDVIRKVIDDVWRQKMTYFVGAFPKEAEGLIRWLNADDKFTMATFSQERRTEFKKMLGQHVSVTPEDIDKSISVCLDNVGIYAEIQTAVATYQGAKEFLAMIRQDRVA